MDRRKVQQAVDYWFATAAHDYDTMRALFASGRYSDSLFYGHIVLEKILKGHVTADINDDPPRSHDLLRLYEKTRLTFSKEEIDLLDTVNQFNIRARYPDYKLAFYKICTKEYTKKYFDRISFIYKKLCQNKPQRK